MKQLLCEPEDRLGSQASSSVSRPDSMVIQARRSGFIIPESRVGASVDGAELIKVLYEYSMVRSGEVNSHGPKTETLLVSRY